MLSERLPRVWNPW